MSNANMTNAILNCSRPVAEDDGRTYSCPACGEDDDSVCECAEAAFQAHVDRTCPALVSASCGHCGGAVGGSAQSGVGSFSMTRLAACVCGQVAA